MFWADFDRQVAELPSPKVPVEPAQYRTHLAANLQRDIPWLPVSPTTDRHMLILGSAPSLSDYIDEIRERQEQGSAIAACNGAITLLHECGIRVDYAVIMDPRPGMERFVPVTPDPATTWLVASCADPAVFDALSGRPVMMWHPLNGDTVDLIDATGRVWFGVTGGSTTPSRMMGIGRIMGFHNFTLYGVDSSFSRGTTHADRNEVALYYANPYRVVDVEGVQYLTMTNYLRQAGELIEIMTYLPMVNARADVRGDGLLPHMWACVKREIAE